MAVVPAGFRPHLRGALTVLDYIRFAAKFTISTQQEYRWAEH